MRKCLHCGKVSKKLVVLDEDEIEYLCQKCSKEEHRQTKKKLDHARNLFGKK